jgi:hypothetical protein
MAIEEENYIEFISLIGGVIGVQKHPPLLFIVIN